MVFRATVSSAEFENAAHADGAVVRTVLVVDDSRVQRRILSAQLSRWGYKVLEARSGLEALEICAQTAIDIVVSDWMMPGMNGLEFCKAFREMEREGYGYFILLTSKTEKGEVAHGLENGADDYLSKPVNGAELRARIRAGERILRMERELKAKNSLVTKALKEIQSLYNMIDRDLIEAKKLQQSLVSDRHKTFGSADISLLLRPSGHVGGDLVGFFPAGENQLGLYAIDVSGHGITSALMTARLAGSLSSSSPDQNLALIQLENGEYAARPPCQVIQDLNEFVLTELDTEHYFTLVLAFLDLETGRIIATQAGHPHPAVQKADGQVEFVGKGGMPVGLIADATYSEFELTLHPGDRLLLMSDGVTECADPDGNLLDEDGLTALMKRNAAVSGEAFLEAMMWDLQAFSGENDFTDDVSAILVEFRGRAGAKG